MSDERSHELLTAEEVAAQLRVTKDWVYRAVRRGRLPYVRVGRYVRFTQEAIDTWVAEGGTAHEAD